MRAALDANGQGGWRKTEAQLSVDPLACEAPTRDPSSRQDAEEISVEVRRTELERSVLNAASAYDSLSTERTKVLRLTATTPDGPLTLDLPVAGQPGIKEFEQTIKEGQPE